jgi:hypothetical protein
MITGTLVEQKKENFGAAHWMNNKNQQSTRRKDNNFLKIPELAFRVP